MARIRIDEKKGNYKVFLKRTRCYLSLTNERTNIEGSKNERTICFWIAQFLVSFPRRWHSALIRLSRIEQRVRSAFRSDNIRLFYTFIENPLAAINRH